MSIPKEIHYCWFGGKPFPRSALKCIKSWKKYCPDYRIVLHNEENYDVYHNRYAREAYEAGKWAFVSDVARLEMIYEHGGIYFDTDVELLKPIDELLDAKGFMGFEDENQVATGLGFAAEAHSPVIKRLLDDYEERSFLKPDGSYDLTPCPVINTRALESLGLRPDGTYQEVAGFRFYPKEYFSPQNYSSGLMTHLTENTYSIHHYDASWKTKEFRRKKNFKRFWGSPAMMQIKKPVKWLLGRK